MTAELAERQTALEESPDENAAELANQFAEFSNNVNDAMAKLPPAESVEAPQNKLDDVNRRLREIESWMDTTKDVREMSTSEAADQLTDGQVGFSVCL